MIPEGVLFVSPAQSPGISNVHYCKGALLFAGKNSRHVVPNPNGGWDVKKPGASRVSAHRDTQADAEARAKEILGNTGGGEAVIHGRDGRIRDADTVAPGRDPAPPIDQKH